MPISVGGHYLSSHTIDHQSRILSRLCQADKPFRYLSICPLCIRFPSTLSVVNKFLHCFLLKELWFPAYNFCNQFTVFICSFLNGMMFIPFKNYTICCHAVCWGRRTLVYRNCETAVTIPFSRMQQRAEGGGRGGLMHLPDHYMEVESNPKINIERQLWVGRGNLSKEFHSSLPRASTSRCTLHMRKQHKPSANIVDRCINNQ